MKCSCGALLANDARYCHQCGIAAADIASKSDWLVAPESNTNETSRRPWKYTGLILALIALVMFSFWLVYLHQTMAVAYGGAFKVVVGCIFEMMPWVFIPAVIVWQIMRKPKASVNEKTLARNNILGSILIMLAIFVSVRMVDGVLPRLKDQALLAKLSGSNSQTTSGNSSSSTTEMSQDKFSNAQEYANASLNSNTQFQIILSQIAIGKVSVTSETCNKFWGFFPQNLVLSQESRESIINTLVEGEPDQIAFWESVGDSARYHKIEMTKAFMASKLNNGPFSEEIQSALSAAAAGKSFTINNTKVLITKQLAQQRVDELQDASERLQRLVKPGCL